jgi:peptidoglycan/xylan/chitin deacetylase (PgdA/CDA1 family)
MKEDITRQLMILTRKHLHLIWEASKQGIPLKDEESQRLAEVLQQHQQYHNAWEFGDQIEDAEYVVDEVNPFLHATFHCVIENQLATGDPPEARLALERLTQKKLSRHEAIHRIAQIFVEEVFPMLKENRPFDRERYAQKLKKLR